MERKRNGAELDAQVAQKSYAYVVELTRTDFDRLENNIESAIVQTKNTFIGSGTESPESKLDNHLTSLSVRPYLAWDDEIYPKFTQKRVYSS